MSLFAVGSYTQHPSLDARGEGISIVDWNDTDDAVDIIDISDQVINPSYLDWEASERRLYSVSEVDGRMGAVAAFSVDATGHLEYLGQQKGLGKSACHLKVLPSTAGSTDGMILSASYSDGRLTSYHLSPAGVGPVIMSRLYEGSGPDTERQSGSHAHQISTCPYSTKLYLCDLGSDSIWMHSPATVNETEVPPERALKVPAGYGPRHLAWDPVLPVAYILCELVPRILVVRITPETGLMEIIQELDTVESGRMEMAAPAAVKVHPSGNTVAVSNRFDDTIAVFGIDRSTDRPEPLLSLISRFPCGGKAPRDIEFNTDGSRLFIANQDSHAITCRYFNPESGVPVEGWAAPLETGSPVCVVMLT